MDDLSIRPKALSEPGLQMEAGRQLRAWRELLAHCHRKPTRKYVHRLRVATLRLQAAFESSLRCIDTGFSSAKPMERWVRQAKKLRRALGPVRQADVSLDKLGMVRAWAGRASNAPAVFPQEHLGAIEEIERVVKRRRNAAEKKLVAEIARRRKRLNHLSRKLENAPDYLAAIVEAGVAGTIRTQIAAAAAEFPVLDIGNLHRFRKRVKKIRYLAEVFAPIDSAAEHQASALKRMTGSIGEWHDWQALAEVAGRAGRKNASAAAAAEFLRAQARRSFTHARALCISSLAALLEGEADIREQRAIPAQEPNGQAPRKPVVSVSAAGDGRHAARSAQIVKLAG